MPVAKEEYLVPKHNYHVVALEYASVIASSSSNANVLKTWVCTIYLAYASTSRNSSNIFNLVIRNCILYLLEDERSSMPCCSICLDDGEQWRFKNSLLSWFQTWVQGCYMSSKLHNISNPRDPPDLQHFLCWDWIASSCVLSPSQRFTCTLFCFQFE